MNGAEQFCIGVYYYFINVEVGGQLARGERWGAGVEYHFQEI